MATWYTPEEAQDDWRDAPVDDVYLQQLLDVAAFQILAYGPKRIADAIADDEAAVPIHYRQAHLLQTRNLWNSSKTDPQSGAFGEPGFAITPFPLDWTIKAIIRPKTGVPVVR